MSSSSFTEEWVSSADFSNRCKARTTEQTAEDNRITEEITKKNDASTVNSKVDFFRSMGLEYSNCFVMICNRNNDYDLQTSYEQPCRSSSKISERLGDSFDDIPEESFDWKSRSKDKNLKNNRTRDMVVDDKIIPLIKECKVSIVGEKCKVCGRSFKCIRDVQIHVKKKHRRRKPRKKLVLKIGDEVISRVPIKRKHLKCLHKEKQRTIDSSDEEDLGSDEISDEDIAPFVDLAHTNETWPRLMDTDENGIVLQDSKDIPRLELAKLGQNEDEEIQVVLRITRPRKSMEINHETPNRNERELLISDAIQEFIRMDKCLVGIEEPSRDIKAYRQDTDVCRLASIRLQNDNLDSEEHNCSFHIENEDDIDSGIQELNSLLPEKNEYSNDETASIHSQHYRNENGDVIPDFIDYTHCMDDRTSNHRNINNDAYELECLFYNEARINEWNKEGCGAKPAGFDIHQNTSRSLVLIKEEIMLDDLL